ncbi:hypothetical protein CR513_60640, partial [Mucuna pruriens]
MGHLTHFTMKGELSTKQVVWKSLNKMKGEDTKSDVTWYTSKYHNAKRESRYKVKKYAFLGYKAGMNRFVTYDLSSREILVFRHVMFYEHIFPCVLQHKNLSSHTSPSTLTLNIEPTFTSTLNPNHGKSNQEHYESITSLPLPNPPYMTKIPNSKCPYPLTSYISYDFLSPTTQNLFLIYHHITFHILPSYQRYSLG